MRLILKRGNDQIVTLTGLQADGTGEYLNDALVKATLLDGRGQPIPPFQNLTMPYKAGSDGEYEWIIDAPTMMLAKNVEYLLVITAKQGELDYRTVRPVTVED